MRKKFFSLLAISVLLLVMDNFHWTDPVKAALEPSITGIKDSIYGGFYRIKFLPSIFLNYSSLTEQNEERIKLKAENSAMKIKIAGLEADNMELRKQLGAPLAAGYRLIPADVIALSRHMEINAGSENGIGKGMIVVEGQTLIGKISELTVRRSKVLLLTDNELQVPAITSRGARGIISGQLSENISLSGVLQKDPLFLGDTITTTGEEGFPRDLLIGKVVHIEIDDVAVYKTAQVEPLIDFRLLKKVFVMDGQ